MKAISRITKISDAIKRISKAIKASKLIVDDQQLLLHKSKTLTICCWLNALNSRENYRTLSLSTTASLQNFSSGDAPGAKLLQSECWSSILHKSMYLTICYQYHSHNSWDNYGMWIPTQWRSLPNLSRGGLLVPKLFKDECQSTCKTWRHLHDSTWIAIQPRKI